MWMSNIKCNRSLSGTFGDEACGCTDRQTHVITALCVHFMHFVQITHRKTRLERLFRWKCLMRVETNYSFVVTSPHSQDSYNYTELYSVSGCLSVTELIQHSSKIHLASGPGEHKVFHKHDTYYVQSGTYFCDKASDTVRKIQVFFSLRKTSSWTAWHFCRMAIDDAVSFTALGFATKRKNYLQMWSYPWSYRPVYDN
jgi:hypothetical protein